VTLVVTACSGDTSSSTTSAAEPDASEGRVPSARSDEFEDGSSLDQWTRLDEVEGWPDTLQEVSVRDGVLRLVPWTTAWYADFHGPMLFEDVSGDFVATARVRSSGVAGGVPDRTYSLAGLIARAPRDVTPATWAPGGEDYVFITAGVGDVVGVPKVETKSTDDSVSDLTLKQVPAGWVDLQIVRSGDVFVMLYRPDAGEWVVSDRFVRADLPPDVQIGIVAYTDWEGMERFHSDPAGYHATVVRDGEPDLVAEVDFVHVDALPSDIDPEIVRSNDAALVAALAPLS
jgi:hypothetical protein